MSDRYFYELCSKNPSLLGTMLKEISNDTPTQDDDYYDLLNSFLDVDAQFSLFGKLLKFSELRSFIHNIYENNESYFKPESSDNYLFDSNIEFETLSGWSFVMTSNYCISLFIRDEKINNAQRIYKSIEQNYKNNFDSMSLVKKDKICAIEINNQKKYYIYGLIVSNVSTNYISLLKSVKRRMLFTNPLIKEVNEENLFVIVTNKIDSEDKDIIINVFLKSGIFIIEVSFEDDEK